MSSTMKQSRDNTQTQIEETLRRAWGLLEDLKKEKVCAVKQEKISALMQLVSLIVNDNQTPQNAVNRVKQLYPDASYSLFFPSRVNRILLSLSTINEAYIPEQKCP